jgi:hypothetical protein
MKLLTKELARRIPPLGSTDAEDDPMVVAKWFTPWSSWTWYAIEGATNEHEHLGLGDCPPGGHRPLSDWDGGDVLFFGLVQGLDQELGYFTLGQLEAVRGPGGLRVERDLYFRPRRLSEVPR